MEFKDHCIHLYNRGREGDDVDLLDGGALFEIEIVPDDDQEIITAVELIDGHEKKMRRRI
jgi:hypothetical protein